MGKTVRRVGIVIRMPSSRLARHQHHAPAPEVEADDHGRRHGHAQSEGDRLAGRAGSPGNAVLKDTRLRVAKKRSIIITPNRPSISERFYLESTF
jgi:hypothetical protein